MQTRQTVICGIIYRDITSRCRYGGELMVVESYSENNMSASMVPPKLKRYWLGLASLDDLRTNTLESAAGMLVSQYAGILIHFYLPYVYMFVSCWLFDTINVAR